MTRKRINLLLAAILLISVSVILVSTFNPGQTASSKNLKSKLLRRKDQIKLKPGKDDIATLRKQALPQQERELYDKIPKQVPIKIKIKAEKEKKFKDLSNEQWLRDIELEVTNTSNKPIYFLEFFLVFPEVISENGHQVGMHVRYGRIEFIDFDTLPLPSDVPIPAGATHTFTILETFIRGWEQYRLRENKPVPRKVQLIFAQLSFGDGSGFNGTDAKPYPYT